MAADPNPLALSQDAAIVLALAETAIPFASSPEDEAERWVRVLRMHGHVGEVFQSLGVGEAPLATAVSEPKAVRLLGRRAPDDDIVGRVAAHARQCASARSAERISTVDILCGVFEEYGRAFDRALYVRGTTREELLERVAAPDRSVAG